MRAETSVWLCSTSTLQLGLLLADSSRILSSPLFSTCSAQGSERAIVWRRDELQRRNADRRLLPMNGTASFDACGAAGAREEHRSSAFKGKRVSQLIRWEWMAAKEHWRNMWFIMSTVITKAAGQCKVSNWLFMSGVALIAPNYNMFLILILLRYIWA